MATASASAPADEAAGPQAERLDRLHEPPVRPRRRARPADRGRRPPGGDLQPDDLREGHRPQRRLRRRHPPARLRRGRRRRRLRGPGRRRHPGRPRPLPPGLRPDRRSSTATSAWRSPRCSPTTASGPPPRPRRYWQKLDRPNAMIKIPGTPECVPAIEECLAAGININVTLLFSVEAYEAVAHAYIRALKRRADAGQPVDDIASVASFFVSRIDTEVDKRLDALIAKDVRRRPARPARSAQGQGRHRQRQDRLRGVRANLLRPRVGGPQGQGGARSSACSGPPSAPRTRSTPTRSTSTS